jgi:hypothetical protein
MGSGIVAFVRGDAAKSAQVKSGGELLEFARVKLAHDSGNGHPQTPREDK